MSQFMKQFVVALVAVVMLAGKAVAADLTALDLSAITLSTNPIFVLAGTIAIALAAIWPIRKVIKLFNRS